MAFDLTTANGKVNSRHVSNVLAGVTAGLAMMAMSAGAASAATDDLHPLQSVDGVVSIELRADGSVLVTLADGRVVTLSSAQVTIIDGVVHVADAAAALLAANGSDTIIALTQAEGGESGGGIFGGNNTLLYVLGGLLVAGGAAGAAIGLTGGSNELPVFTSGTTFSIAENTTAVTTVTATDADGDDLIFSIGGGPDAALFSINPTTGALAFINPPNFEAPIGGDNSFTVIVNVADDDDADPEEIVSQTITVTVTNVNEFTAAADIIDGTPGADNFNGLGGDDTITGLGGNDTLIGEAGNDSINGGDGDDTLNGGAGNDSLIGGAGADSFFSDGIDTISGGDGTDSVNFAERTTGIIVDLDINSAGATGTPSQDGGVLTASPAAGGTVLFELDDIENVTGTAFDDGLFGNNENNILIGGAGNDSLHGFGGTDTLNGGGGVDTALFTASTAGITVDLDANGDGTASNGDILIAIENVTGSSTAGDTLTGNDGANTLSGLGGDDTLVGEGGNDTLLGGDGNDTLNGGAGNDVLTGGAGDDGFFSDGIDTISGGDGTDSVNFAERTTGIIVDLDINSAGATGTPSQDGGVLTASPAAGGTVLFELDDIENVTGTAFDDGLFGNNENNILIGGAGNDSLHGFGGTDTLNGGGGVDTALFTASTAGITVDLDANGDGTASNGDILIAIENVTGSSTAGDTLTGNDGANTLSGLGGDDTLVGEGGNDTLLGGDGNDTLNGGAGNDVLTGGAGNDGFFSDGIDTISGGDGTDTVNFAERTTGIIVDLDVNSAGATGTPSQDGGVLTASPAAGGTVLFELDDIENVTGTAFDDGLFGNNENNILIGGAGNDSLHGFGGTDTLNGGGGVDTALFTASTAGITVDLDANGDGTASNGDILIAIENVTGSSTAGDTLTGNDGANTLSGLGGDDTLVGEGGNDILLGGTGNDTLTGGAGDDSFFSDGIDTINGGDGTDSVSFAERTTGIIVDLDINSAGATGTPSQDGGVLTASPAAGGTVLFELDDIENVTGTAFDDGLFGNNENNILIGGAGNDSLHGFGGTDTLDGGAGIDTALFTASTMGITVSLDANGNGNASNGDVLVAIENITGSSTAGDTLIGNDAANTLSGLGGDDVLTGGGGDDVLLGGDGSDVIDGGAGANSLDGGAGIDTANFASAQSGVIVDLAAGLAQTGGGLQVFATPGTDTAEIVAFDVTTDQFFIAGGSAIDVLNSAGDLIATLPISTEVTSVAVGGGFLAAAIVGDPVTEPGQVLLFSLAGLTSTSTPIATFTVGALPDSLAFNPQGNRLVVANEGEADGGVDPEGSISVITLNASNLTASTVNTLTLTQFNAQQTALVTEGLILFGQAQGDEAGLDFTVAQDLEPEFVTISPDGQLAFVSVQENNALLIVDIANPVPSIIDLVPLGSVNLETVPIDGNDDNGFFSPTVITASLTTAIALFQPDGLDSFTLGGLTFVVSANEGDGRDFDVFDADAGAIDLDPNFFTTDEIDFIQDNGVGVGDLEISLQQGDLDNNGLVERIVAFGGRSFSIFDTAGNLVFNSANLIEQAIGEVFPLFFNDSRSDDAGPEPEAVTVGVIDGQTILFVGLERSAGVLAFALDLVNGTGVNGVAPQISAELLGFITVPVPGGFPLTDDLDDLTAPEGLIFIPASDSPTGQPFLVISDEEQGVTFGFNVNLGATSSSTLANFENVTGSAFADQISGNNDANLLVGLGGDDVLAGLGGDDVLNGDVGVDTLLGGDGNDTLISDGLDVLNGGAGNDSAQFTTAVHANLSTGALDAVTVLNDGSVDLSGSGAAPTAFTLGAGVSRITNVVANAAAGAPPLPPQDVDIVTITVPEGFVLSSLTLSGLLSTDDVGFLAVVTGATFPADALAAGFDPSVLLGLANFGNGTGASALTGTNILPALGAGGGLVPPEAFIGFDGAAGLAAGTYTFLIQQLGLATLGYTLDFTVTAVGAAASQDLIGVENLVGSAAGDVLTGDDNANILNGAGGNDVLVGLGGDDVINSDGVDDIDGGEGIDTVDFSGRTTGIIVDLDTFSAGATGTPSQEGGVLTSPPAAGGTTLFELDDIENVIGTAFDDSLFGNNEANVLTGGVGNDSLHGFGGVDTLDGGAGVDTALFTASTAGITVDLDADGNATASNGDVLIAVENVTGSSTASDNLAGNDGANILSGLGGDDILSGEGGNDTLIGGDGVDILVGGAGNDSLTGGAGADIFVIGANSGDDIVTDFALAEDLIDVSALGLSQAAALALAVSDGAGGTIITFSPGNTLTLSGVAPADLTAANFIGFTPPLPPGGLDPIDPDGPPNVPFSADEPVVSTAQFGDAIEVAADSDVALPAGSGDFFANPIAVIPAFNQGDDVIPVVTVPDITGGV